MRALLRLLFLIISFISVSVGTLYATEIAPVCESIVSSNSEFVLLDDSEDYYLVANNNNYEISVARKEANNDFSDERNKTKVFDNLWNIDSYAEDSHSLLGKNYKISSYLKNVICIRAP